MTSMRVGVQVQPQHADFDGHAPRVARGRGARRRHRLHLGPLLPALRRARRQALRGPDHAGVAGRDHRAGADRRAGRLQLLPQPGAAGRRAPHDRPHLRRPRRSSASARAGSSATTTSTATSSAPRPTACASCAAALPRIEKRLAQAQPAAGRRDPDPDRRRRREGHAQAGRPARATSGTRFGDADTFQRKDEILRRALRRRSGRDPARSSAPGARATTGSADVDDAGRAGRAAVHRRRRRRRLGLRPAPLRELIRWRDG